MKAGALEWVLGLIAGLTILYRILPWYLVCVVIVAGIAYVYRLVLIVSSYVSKNIYRQFRCLAFVVKLAFVK